MDLDAFGFFGIKYQIHGYRLRMALNAIFSLNNGYQLPYQCIFSLHGILFSLA